MDDYDRWCKNCADTVQRQSLIRYGWLPEREITYSFNSHGFRSPEFNSAPAVLCLGCSHTMGIGLPIEETWPTILQQRLELPCWNLGLGGAALDTLFRITDYYVNYLNVTAVLCLVPEITRFEFFIHNQPEVCNWYPDEKTNDFFKIWIADNQNSEINRRKNLLAIQKICDTVRVPFLCFADFIDTIPNLSRARDLMHYGYAAQKAIAEHFYNMMLSTKGYK